MFYLYHICVYDSRAQCYRHYGKQRAGGIMGKSGRQIFARSGLLSQIKKTVCTRDIQQRSFTPRELDAHFLNEKRKEARAAGKNPHAVALPCARTMWKYRKLVAPDVVKKPSVQNERRLLVT